MKRAALLLLCTAGLSLACSTQPEERLPHASQAEATQSRLLITVNNGKNEQLLGSPSRIFNYQSKYGRSIRANSKLRQLSNEYNLTPHDAWPITSLGVLCQVFSISTNNHEQLLTKLRADPRVDSVQLMNHFYVNADLDHQESNLEVTPTKRISPSTLQSGERSERTKIAEVDADSHKIYSHLQDNLLKLKVLDAHQFSTGKNVTVAIIDTHIDRTHQDLTGRVVKQLSALDSVPTSPDRHGTAVAGIIAANAQDQHGITGIAPDASLLAITACWPMPNAAGQCNSFTLARALDIAIDKQVDIINLSLSGPPDALLKRILESAIRQKIMIVGAYGDAQKSTFPTYIEGVLSVAVHTQHPAVLQLPGTDVLTTAPYNRYDFVSGNSMAAAQLSGIVALVLDVVPNYSAAQLRGLFNQALNNSQLLDACAMISALSEQWNCIQPGITTTHTINSAPNPP